MANPGRRTDRPLLGWLIVVAGVLFAIVLLLALGLSTTSDFTSRLVTLAVLALAAAFAAVALTVPVGLIGRIAFWVGALGWVLLALGGIADLGVVGQVAAGLAGVGSLVGGILLFVRRGLSRRAGLFFLIAMIVAALYLLPFAVPGLITGTLPFFITIAFAVLLIAAGALIVQKR
jgi:hypothetical protein